MSEWIDLSNKDKRGYLGWRATKEKQLGAFFDKRVRQFKELTDIAGVTIASRNAVKADGEAELDTRWAAITVDQYIVERDAPPTP